MEYEEIIERIQRVITEPVKPIPEEILEKEKDEYFKINARSFEIYEEAKGLIPGGVEHNLATTNPFPLAMDRAKGYKIWDVDGNEYVDYLLCGGPIILGHHYEPLDNEIIKLVEEKGPSTGLTNEYEILAAKKIIEHMPGVEMVRFLQSGTEADMAALRVARAITGRQKVIKVGGGYHGWYDQYVWSLHIPGTGALNSIGIPPSVFELLIDIRPNDFDALEKAFEDNKGEIAAVVVEPVGGESGAHPVHPDWNKRCRELSSEHGALLIFDEVVTGFRLDMGGAQKYFDVIPDLTILGKIIAHGYPSAGAVAGKKEYMEILGKGMGQEPYIGGTLAANPITCAACYHAITLMEKNDAIKKSTEFANRLVNEMNSLFATRPDIPFFLYNFGPIIHYVTTAFFMVDLTSPKAVEIFKRKELAEEYQIVTSNMGLNALAGTRMYTCMQHDDEALEKTLKAWEYLLSLIPKS
ncbi:MAG: aminotransferase class III-fold pyridoxal phosphate-dependent enzyme [Actinomycetota bacterium]|nr:aminotransferase class III-fold pyridoxal phosphate-dependent enzyme [Actinomycetota bacterium]